MKRVGQILEEVAYPNRPKNLTREFQNFGVYLAEELDDTNHYSLYIKLAKDCNRTILEEALSYAKGYTKAKSKARIFMWRLTQLRRNKS